MDGRVEHEERLIEEFEEMTKNAERVQRETLQKILDESRKTEYLQKYLGQKGSTDIDPSSFKACVPLATYSDVEPYIQRIVAGESSLILTGAPVTAFTISSGTTQGRPKTYLFSDEIVDFILQMFCTSQAFRNRDFPIGSGKALQIFYTSCGSQRKGGLPAGVISTNVFLALQQKNRPSAAQQFTPTTPAEVILGQEFEETVYCHLLCGLIYREQVQLVAANFAHNIVHAFRTFEKIWEEICHDIRLGILTNRISSPSVRAAVSKLVLLEPNPELADLIYKMCVDLISSNWSGSIAKLFPNAKYICAVMTGTLQYYSKKLRHYAGNQLPLISGDYGASEAYIGININPKLPPEMVSFSFIPSSAYYEFIPTRKRDSEFKKESRTHSSTSVSSEPDPVGLTQVEVGKEYEIVITNPTGLYRYRLGDVVKITGFHNSTPQVQFVRRSSSLLCVNNDMTTETELDQVVGKASELLADEELELVDFTSRVDLSTRPGHYVIVWEVNGEGNDEIFVECCNLMDRSFGDTHYVLSRKTNDIGALELQVVRSGTLQKIAAHYVGQGASFGQFKMPRCMVTTDDAVLQILSSNLVGTYFSTVYD